MSAWSPKSWDAPSEERRLRIDDSFARDIATALTRWAEAHPLRDRPFIDLMADRDGSDDVGLSPRDLAQAFGDRQHPEHEDVVRLFEVGLSGYRGEPHDLID